jgi:hypothetical protein
LTSDPTEASSIAWHNGEQAIRIADAQMSNIFNENYLI